MKSDSGYSVLVDLDAVLDTRLGTISLFDENIAMGLSTNKDYVNRLFDEFSFLIDHPDWKDEDFKETYEKRNQFTLAASRPTPTLYSLKPFLLALVADCANNPDKSNVDVIINLYPYVLSKDEKIDIMAAVSVYCPEHVKITSTWLSPEEVSPQYARSELTHWFTYDLDAWITAHFGRELTEDKLKGMKVPRFNIVCPKRFKSKQAFEEYKEILKSITDENAIKDPFLEQAFVMLDFVALDFRDMFQFSIISTASDPSGKYMPKTA